MRKNLGWYILANLFVGLNEVGLHSDEYLLFWMRYGVRYRQLGCIPRQTEMSTRLVGLEMGLKRYTFEKTSQFDIYMLARLHRREQAITEQSQIAALLVC
jgi:hypothetical protein